MQPTAMIIFTAWRELGGVDEDRDDHVPGAAFASRTSDTWPSWSPPVCTSAVVAFFARSPSRARRNAGIVRTIMGPADIRARSLRLNPGGGEAAGPDFAAGMPTLSRPNRGRQAGAEKSGFDRSRCCDRARLRPQSVVRFIIKAGDARFSRVVAHFT